MVHMVRGSLVWRLGKADTVSRPRNAVGIESQ